ncbi:MAG: HAMP domain-containing histidine kinase [Bdellovibrionaceae bacterium]|nr:HAMP domain-containing histidine kinase [Pseudobdellovibrionaceae bacterium]
MPAVNISPRTSILSILPLPANLSHLEARELGWPLSPDRGNLKSDVLIAPVEVLLSDRFMSLWSELKFANTGTQLIVIAESQTPPELVFEVQRELPVFRIYESLDEPDLEWGIFEAVERSHWFGQNEQLQKLVADQTERMKNLHAELEDRVQKRQRYLEEARRKNLIAQFRWQTLKQATEATHEASTVGEMERQLTQVLQESLNLLEVRIILHQQSSLAQTDRADSPVAIHRVRLFQDQDVLIGFALFLRDKGWPFTLEEKDFLQKISEGIALAVRRLNQMEITRTLREQWQATFNAITDPVGLITANYDIIQSNSAFQAKARGHHAGAAIPAGAKCYRVLFDRDSPCVHCHLGRSFRLEPGRGRPETWDVTSQPLVLAPGEDPVFFHQYLDITEQLRMERRLIEGARLAELGIIGSSIAHELNNPLGGILSFVQMMKMDLPPDSPHRSDVEEMENGVLRCRDIVQNLLGFTRSSHLEEKKNFDLREALQRALAILDLQTRSQGFEARRSIPAVAQMVKGNPNLLSQALTNLMQNAVQNLTQGPSKNQPQIEILMNDLGAQVEIRILDNGPGAGAAPTLSLPLAQQIFLDHDANLEILLPGRGLRLVKVTMPKIEIG